MISASKLKVVTSGRLTAETRRGTTGAVVQKVTKPPTGLAYSLYSTDSEDQVSTIHKGLDRCASLLDCILQADWAEGQPSQKEAVKSRGQGSLGRRRDVERRKTKRLKTVAASVLSSRSTAPPAVKNHSDGLDADKGAPSPSGPTTGANHPSGQSTTRTNALFNRRLTTSTPSRSPTAAAPAPAAPRAPVLSLGRAHPNRALRGGPSACFTAGADSGELASLATGVQPPGPPLSATQSAAPSCPALAQSHPLPRTLARSHPLPRTLARSHPLPRTLARSHPLLRTLAPHSLPPIPLFQRPPQTNPDPDPSTSAPVPPLSRVGPTTPPGPAPQPRALVPLTRPMVPSSDPTADRGSLGSPLRALFPTSGQGGVTSRPTEEGRTPRRDALISSPDRVLTSRDKGDSDPVPDGALAPPAHTRACVDRGECTAEECTAEECTDQGECTDEGEFTAEECTDQGECTSEQTVDRVQRVLEELWSLLAGKGGAAAERLLSEFERAAAEYGDGQMTRGTQGTPKTQRTRGTQGTQMSRAMQALRSQNSQLHRRVRILNQQLQDRERAERHCRESHCDATSLQAELGAVRSQMGRLQAEVTELRKALHEKEAENARIRADLIATSSPARCPGMSSQVLLLAQRRLKEMESRPDLCSVLQGPPLTRQALDHHQRGQDPSGPSSNQVRQYLSSLGPGPPGAPTACPGPLAEPGAGQAGPGIQGPRPDVWEDDRCISVSVGGGTSDYSGGGASEYVVGGASESVVRGASESVGGGPRESVVGGASGAGLDPERLTFAPLREVVTSSLGGGGGQCFQNVLQLLQRSSALNPLPGLNQSSGPPMRLRQSRDTPMDSRLDSSSLAHCEVTSDWSVGSGSTTFNTRDEAEFCNGLAALDASIASLQRTLKKDLVT